MKLPRRLAPNTEATRRFGLARKLLLGFGVVTVLLAATGYLGVTSAGTLHSSTTHLAGQDVKNLQLITELANRVGELTTDVAGSVSLLDSPDKLAAQIDQFGDFDKQIQQLIAEIGANEPEAGVDAAIAALNGQMQSYTKLRDDQLVPALRAGNFTAAEELIENELDDLAEGLQERQAAVAEAQTIASTATVAEASDVYDRTRTVLLAITILGVLLAAGIALTLAHRIGRRLRRLGDGARAIADGDFSHRTDVQSKDELQDMAAAFNEMAERLEASKEMEEAARQEGRRAMASMYESFARRVAQGDLTARVVSDNPEFTNLAGNMNEMVEGLGGLSGEVREATKAISGATSQILSVVSQHNAASAEQAASIAQTSVTVDEVRATAQQAAARAQSLADQARNAAAASDEGHAAIASITEGMGLIRDRVEEIARDILTLSDRTQAIHDITQTVNDLADQSNMLALNATIEAAKAGEHGRGFAVVADEVRLLAEQSKSATARVREILAEIQTASEKAVMATEAGTRVVEAGAAGAREAGKAIERMSTSVQETALVASQIAAAAKEQSVGMEQIGQAMTDVAATTNQIAVGADQTQHAARSLADLADRLDALTGRYVLSAEAPTP